MSSLNNELISLKRNAQRLLPPGLNAAPPIALMATNDNVPVASGDSLDLAIIVPEKYPYHIYGMSGTAFSNVTTDAGTLADALTEEFDYKVAIYQGAGAWYDKNIWARNVLPNVTSVGARMSGMFEFPYILQVEGGEQIRITLTYLGVSTRTLRHFQIAFHGYRILGENLLRIK